MQYDLVKALFRDAKCKIVAIYMNPQSNAEYSCVTLRR